MKWIACGGYYIGHNKGPYPYKPGHYRVMISGDSECDDMGGVIYDFSDYETWAQFDYPNEDNEPIGFFMHDEDIETMIAWYGPIEIPKCELFTG